MFISDVNKKKTQRKGQNSAVVQNKNSGAMMSWGLLIVTKGATWGQKTHDSQVTSLDLG